VCKCVLPKGDNPIAVNKYISIRNKEIKIDLLPYKPGEALRVPGV
jgi:hypothetical protein